MKSNLIINLKFQTVKRNRDQFFEEISRIFTTNIICTYHGEVLNLVNINQQQYNNEHNSPQFNALLHIVFLS